MLYKGHFLPIIPFFPKLGITERERTLPFPVYPLWNSGRCFWFIVDLFNEFEEIFEIYLNTLSVCDEHLEFPFSFIIITNSV